VTVLDLKPDIDGLRCAAWARAVHLDPIGTIGSYRGFLLVETPLPWPRDVGEIPELARLRPTVAAAGLRLQALVPGGEGPRRVTAYVRPDAGADGPRLFSRFVRREATVDGDLAATVESLLGRVGSSDPRDGDPTDGEPGDRGGASGGADPALRDLLVCTHGRRDACCGSRGTDLVSALERADLPADVRLSRTSHTGGHRFAATFIVLPEATAWAFADVALVEQVLGRRGDAAEVADRYRGCAGLAGPRVQAVEREVFRQVGWEILDRDRIGHEGGPRLPVRLTVARPRSGIDVWEAEVTEGRTMPVPDCGQPIAEAKKSETEWVVSGLRRV
jgi:hypothetical protein